MFAEAIVTWIDAETARVTWTSDDSSRYWSVFVDGKLSGSVVGVSGETSIDVPAAVSAFHSIQVVASDSPLGTEDAPVPARIRAPVICWLPEENAAQYEIYQVDGETEYLLDTVPESGETYYQWSPSVAVLSDGVTRWPIRVYARGSWGLCEVPYVLVGFLAGYPRLPNISVNETSSGDLELILS